MSSILLWGYDWPRDAPRKIVKKAVVRVSWDARHPSPTPPGGSPWAIPASFCLPLVELTSSHTIKFVPQVLRQHPFSQLFWKCSSYATGPHGHDGVLVMNSSRLAAKGQSICKLCSSCAIFLSSLTLQQALQKPKILQTSFCALFDVLMVHPVQSLETITALVDSC